MASSKLKPMSIGSNESSSKLFTKGEAAVPFSESAWQRLIGNIALCLNAYTRRKRIAQSSDTCWDGIKYSDGSGVYYDDGNDKYNGLSIRISDRRLCIIHVNFDAENRIIFLDHFATDEETDWWHEVEGSLWAKIIQAILTCIVRENISVSLIISPSGRDREKMASYNSFYANIIRDFENRDEFDPDFDLKDFADLMISDMIDIPGISKKGSVHNKRIIVSDPSGENALDARLGNYNFGSADWIVQPKRNIIISSIKRTCEGCNFEKYLENFSHCVDRFTPLGYLIFDITDPSKWVIPYALEYCKKYYEKEMDRWDMIVKNALAAGHKFEPSVLPSHDKYRQFKGETLKFEF